MDAKTLRASILQMAIEGKLVPQLDEEPAVGQIGDAPEDVPFEIPEKWKWMKLSDITSKISDGTHHSPVNNSVKNENFPFLYITAKNIKTTGIDLSTATYVSKEIHDEIYARCNPEYGDVLFIKDGATTGTVTQNTLREPFSLLSSVALLKPREFLEGSYLVHAMSSPEFNKDIRNAMAGTGIPRVTLKVLKNILLPIPPVSEQRRIVARLNELLPLVDKFGKAQEALAVAQKEFPERLKSSLLQEAIQGKLVPQLDEEPAVEQIGEAPEDVPFAIPEKWKWVRLSAVGKIIGGGTPKTSSPEYWNGDIPWITPADLGKQKNQNISRGAKSITQLGLDNSSAKLMPAGTVVYSSRAPIGYTAIAQNSLCTNQGCKSLVPDFSVISTEWGYWCLIARTADIVSRASGTTFKEISGKGVGETWIPLPPLTEQRRIVARLNELLPLVTKMAAATAK